MLFYKSKNNHKQSSTNSTSEGESQKGVLSPLLFSPLSRSLRSGNPVSLSLSSHLTQATLMDPAAAANSLHPCILPAAAKTLTWRASPPHGSSYLHAAGCSLGERKKRSLLGELPRRGWRGGPMRLDPDCSMSWFPAPLTPCCWCWCCYRCHLRLRKVGSLWHSVPFVWASYGFLESVVLGTTCILVKFVEGCCQDRTRESALGQNLMVFCRFSCVKFGTKNWFWE